MQLIERLTSDGFTYLAVYLFLFTLTAIECSFPLPKKLRFQFARISVVGLTLMLGLRWKTGTDWEPYLDLFENITPDISTLLAVYHFDIGYVFLNGLVRLFSNNYTIFLLFNSAIGMALIYEFIRRCSPLPNLSIFIFYNSYFVVHFMGGNRRIIAIGFLLLLFSEIQRTSIARFAILQSIAFSFHRTSAIGLLARFIPDKPFSYRLILILFLICGTFGALQISVSLVEAIGTFLFKFSSLPIIEKMVFYGETSAEHVSENVDVFVQTILALSKRAIFLVLFFYALRHEKVNLKFTRLLNIYIVGIAIYLIFIGSPIFQVLSTYFSATEIALTGIATAGLNRSMRIFICGLLFPYGILQLLSAINPYPDLYLPYLWVFSAPRQ